MSRKVWLAVTVFLFAGFVVGEALAEGAKKKDPHCVANFLDACYASCVKAGGQPRFCPDYCQKKKLEYSCP